METSSRQITEVKGPVPFARLAHCDWKCDINTTRSRKIAGQTPFDISHTHPCATVHNADFQTHPKFWTAQNFHRD